MKRELSEAEIEAYKEGAKALKGSDRRLFMARIVKALGRGGQRLAQDLLGWERKTIRKGTHELESGIVVIDHFSARGRDSIEQKLPHFLDDLRELASAQAQTDPTFKTTRLYTRLTAKEARLQLILQKGYTDEQLPCEGVIRRKLNQLGFRLRAVKKSQPKKKHPRRT